MLQKFPFPTFLLALALVQSVSSQDCSLPYVPSEFKARLAWQSNQNTTSVVASPMVANMNPQEDSIPEILVIGSNGQMPWNQLQIFRGDGSNANNPLVLNIPGGFEFYPAPGPTIGDVNADGIPELLIGCSDSRIRVFRNYTENPAAPMQLWITSSQQMDLPGQRPLLADFDANGVPEVYAGSDVFSFDFSNPVAPTLNKTLNGGAMKGQAQFSDYFYGACNPVPVDILTEADCNGDPDCAGLELVAGAMIYSIDLDPNDGDGAQIKIQRNLNAMNPASGYEDGYTSVADLNLDGMLDIVVTAVRQTNQFGMYVWNKNGLIKWFPYPASLNVSNNGSLACIANIYDDTKSGFPDDHPEILICRSNNLTCYSLRAPSLFWWNLPTSDNSGWTGSTVYDFNGDGIYEVVYRDETDLRILYGGATPFPAGVDAQRNWFKTPCFSGTADEYPVVADVDNDGETEIAVTGRATAPPPPPNNAGERFKGLLRVYESDNAPWVPCRNVWNQFNYFIVNVNDDLTIPAPQQAHHLEMPAPGSGKRPLNTFLSQRPLLNDNLEPFIPLPDAAASSGPYVCNGDSLTVQLNICNPGDKTLKIGTPIAFYASDPTTTNAVLLGAIQWTSAPVQKDSCRVFQFKIPKTLGTIFGVVNDDGTQPRPFSLAADFPVNDVLECDFLNNIFQLEIPALPPPISLGPDIGSCQDTAVLLHVGTGFAQYLWQDGSTDSSFQTQQAGVFWVETTNFCAQKQRDTLVVTLFDSPQIQVDTLNGDCFGKPASAIALAQSAYLPLSYAWSSGENTPDVSGLPDGTYTVTVTNARGCSSTQSSWLEAGGHLEIAAAVDVPILCFGENGALSLSFPVGKPPFNIQWSDGSQTPAIANAPAGNYSVTVTDADFCADTVQILLPQPSALASSGVSVVPTCPGLSTGSAQFLGANAGTPPYQLLWSNMATTPDLSNLPAGNYQLTLSDANGCTLVEDIEVTAFSVPMVDVSKTNVSCFGANDGILGVSILNGTPGFGFAWSNNSTTSGIQNLSPGNYILTLTYADGACTQNFDFQIEEPLPVLLSASASPAICNGGLGGSIDLTVENGVMPLQFLWSNNALTEDLSNVGAGNYQVTVTDSGGCSKTLSQSVSGLPAIVLNATAQAPLCAAGSDGNIQLSASGGVAPFQFAWSNGGNLPLLDGVSAGTYTATVTDAAACTQVLSVQVTQPGALQSAGISASPACPDEANGSVQFLGASQGTPPYTWLWSTGSSDAGLSGLPANNYQLTLTDAHGCSLTESVTVANFLPPVLQAEPANVRCFGQNDGRITTSISGGSPGFAYFWANGATTADINNLAPGDYSLTLTYADGFCAETFDFHIEEPAALGLSDTLVTAVRCFGESNGSIVLSAFGGISPYAYQWTGGQTSEDLQALPAGNYALTLTDENGCTLAAQFLVEQPVAVVLAANIGADTCQTSDGEIQVQVTGGILPYQFLWSNAATSQGLSGLPTGNYALTVTDAHFCTSKLTIQIPQYGLIPTLNTFSDTITCAQPAVGIGVLPNQNNLHYTWSGPGNSLPDAATHTVQTAGNYQVTATNAFGCQASAGLSVLENVELPLAEAGPPALNILCNETSALLSALGSSQGNGFLNRWSWFADGVLVLDTATLLLPITDGGLYIHRVLNIENGCAAQDSIWVFWDEPIAASLAVQAIRCFGYDDAAIAVQDVTGGASPFYYKLDNAAFGAQSNFTGLSPGLHTLQVRDDFGCSWQATVTIDEPEDLHVTLTASDTSLVLGQQLQLLASVQPDTAVLTEIAWQPEGLPYQLQSLQQKLRPENHTEFIIKITDRNGCTAEDRVWVSVYNHKIFVPNIILPGSETNGWITVFGGNGVELVQSLRIFDRWGEQVFERLNFAPNAPQLGWDGSYRGQPLNPGVFVWYADVLLQDGRTVRLQGDVTVAR